MAAERPLGQRVVLRRHPDGDLIASDFGIETFAPPAIGDGEFLVRILFISVDPMLRLFVAPSPLGGVMPPMPLGTTIPGAAVGEVIESHNPAYPIGLLVEGRFGWQGYAVSNGAGVNRVGQQIGPPENALGVGGLPGFTAYVGLEAAGGVKAGQTWLVSGAAGAVGSVVGPLVRSRGGRVVGIAGGADKMRYLLEKCGYDAAVDRLAPDFQDQLRHALPNGAEVYFDNVGGPMLAAMTPFFARGALVLICGLMSQYQPDAASGGDDHLPQVLRAVMFNGLRIQGFTQAGRDALRPAFYKEVGDLVASGAIRSDIHVEEGIGSLPQAMVNLFEHSTTGKVVVRV